MNPLMYELAASWPPVAYWRDHSFQSKPWSVSVLKSLAYRDLMASEEAMASLMSAAVWSPIARVE